MLDWRLEARDAGIEFGQLLSRWGSEGQTKGKLFPAHPQERGAGGGCGRAGRQEGFLRGLAGGAGGPPILCETSLPRADGALPASQKEKDRGGEGPGPWTCPSTPVAGGLCRGLFWGSGEMSRSLSSLPFGFPQKYLDVAVTYRSVTFHPCSSTIWKIFPIPYNCRTLQHQCKAVVPPMTA